MRMAFIASAALAALALHAAPALAQPSWSGDGRLEDGDRRTEEGGPYDEHALQLQAGQRYRIGVDSEEFDPVAELYRRGEAEPVARNDDGEGLNSRIRYTPETSGEYVLRVLGFSSDGRGAYAARAEALAPPPPPISTPGTPVQATGTWLLWQGTLSESDSEHDGRRYDDYLVRFEAGQVRYIMLDGSGFDTLVHILRPDARDTDPLETIDSDDDGGVDLNSLLVFRAAEAGDYIVRVTSYGGIEPGMGAAYRLWVSQ